MSNSHPTEVSKEEMAYAEAMWQVTKEEAEKGDEGGQLLWQILETHYPGDKESQIHTLGFVNQVVAEHRGVIDHDIALMLSRRWGVEKMIVKELFGVILTSEGGE